MADRECDKLHFPSVSPEGRQKGGVFHGILLKHILAANVSAESDLDDDEGAPFLVEGGRVGRKGVRDPSGIDEVRDRAMSGLK